MTNSFDAGQVILCKIHLHKMIYKNISFLTCNIQKSGVDMKKVTIQDVARALGLSRNTVARALNNSDTVAYETRYMVIEKACEMGYQKVSPAALNEFKRIGAQTEGSTIIVLARREISVFWNSIIMGISDAANQNGCRLRFDFISAEDERRLTLPADFQEGVDGVLLISVFSDRYLAEILKLGLPVVGLDCPVNADWGKGLDVVISEGRESVRRLVQKLIDQGLRRIGFIGDITYCRSIKDRYLGYLAALKDNGIAEEKALIATKHTEWRYYIEQDVEQYLDGLDRMPDAIVCANDVIAILLVRALRARGLLVPEDVAVTGFDNQEELSRVEAFLTTVRVGNTRLGKRLACQLLFRLEHPELPNETVTVDTELIFRESSNRFLPHSDQKQMEEIGKNAE